MAKSKTYELAVKIAGKMDSSLVKACADADKNLAKLGASAKATAKRAAVLGAAVVGGVVAANTALYKLGTSFDAAYDAIRIGTGATGDALEQLNDSMRNVYARVPAEMDATAQAIADYNTRLGVTGGVLETLSVQALQVADMLGEDLTSVVESSSQAFQQWSIMEENMAGAMDYIFKVSQSTGVGFNDLMRNMQGYGAQLQEMGYSFEESAALLGQLEKAGVQASEVMAAMKKSVANMAQEGYSASEGMQHYYDAIKNAGSATEAINIASEVFGTRAASTMAIAIRNGTLAAGDLTEELLKSSETIATAADDTYSFAEKWAILRHQMAIAMEPAAMELFTALGDKLEEVTPQLMELAPAIATAAGTLVNWTIRAIEWGIKAGSWIKENRTLVIALAAGILTLVGVFKLLQTALTIINTFRSLSVVLKGVTAGGGLLSKMGGLLNLRFLAIAAVIAAVVAAGVWLYQNWDTVKEKAAELGAKIDEAWNKVSTAVENAIAVVSANFPILGAVLTGVWTSIQDAWESIKRVFAGIIDFINNVFAGNWSDAWSNIVNIFGNLIGMLANLAKAPINAVISAINWVLSKINGISITIPDWVPGVGGKTLGFNLPTIPALAAGGIAIAPTLAEIGEGGEPEAILPLSKLAALLDERGKPSQAGGEGWGGVEEVINFSPVFHFYGAVNKEEAVAAARMSFSEFKKLYKKMKAEERRKSFTTA